MSLLSCLTVIFKHKKKIVIIFTIIVAAVTGVTLLEKPVYEAKSSVLVKIVRDDTPRPGMVVDTGTLSRSVSQEERINTEIEILTGRELAEKVITTLQIEKMYPDLVNPEATKEEIMDQAVQIFGQNLKVIGVRKSNVISVSFQHNDPAIVARAVNMLVDAFKDKHLILHSNPQSSFISGQLASFEAKLRDSEKKLQEYQQENNAFSLEEQRSLLLRQRTELDTAYKMANDSVHENMKRSASIKSALNKIANNKTRYTHTDRDRIVIDARARLLELELREQELKRKYTSSNGLVIDARKQIEMVGQFLKEQEEGIVGKVKTGNPVYQSMEIDLFRAEADLNSQAAKADTLKGQLKQLDKEIAAFDMNESKIQNLRRELSIDEKNFRTYVDRHEDARISDALNKLKLSSISVIEAAVAPVKPIKSNKSLNVLIGLLLGLVFSIASAFFVENISKTFSDSESVERYLDLPVLLTVPNKED